MIIESPIISWKANQDMSITILISEEYYNEWKNIGSEHQVIFNNNLLLLYEIKKISFTRFKCLNSSEISIIVYSNLKFADKMDIRRDKFEHKMKILEENGILKK